MKSKSKSKVYYDRQSVGQPVLVSGTHLGPAANSSPLAVIIFLDNYGFVDLGRPLWLEVGSRQRSLSRVWVRGIDEDNLLPQCWDSSNLEGQVLYLYPPYGPRDPSHWPRGTLHLQKLALTSPTRGGRLVGIVRSRTKATELVSYRAVGIRHADHVAPSICKS
jgi:hypothetical protein